MSHTAIQPGIEFTSRSAAGTYVSRVLRPHHDAGYWETTIISGGHPALLNSIQVVSGADIRRLLAA